jgi:UDP-glucose:(glucosyl)LPS alpha-1,2-glucosyltransferase
MHELSQEKRDLMVIPDLAKNARGGTELLYNELYHRMPYELLSKFQIVPSRPPKTLDSDKIRFYWAHDLVGDPASETLRNGGWKNYHKIIFVSNFQMVEFQRAYGIPSSHCLVVQNAITPIPDHEKPKDVIRLAYWSTPHRGLNILIPVFNKLCEKYDNIVLDVYSSFALYGWEERDKEYEKLFEQAKTNPRITLHGSVSNETIREELKECHILAYPSIWIETSCLVLMEAMSAGMLCVHSNLGALYETAANWTNMYQVHEDPHKHADIFYHVLDQSIASYHNPEVQKRLMVQKSFADAFYNWDGREVQWKALLESYKDSPTKATVEEPTFVYRVGG